MNSEKANLLCSSIQGRFARYFTASQIFFFLLQRRHRSTFLMFIVISTWMFQLNRIFVSLLWPPTDFGAWLCVSAIYRCRIVVIANKTTINAPFNWRITHKKKTTQFHIDGQHCKWNKIYSAFVFILAFSHSFFFFANHFYK